MLRVREYLDDTFCFTYGDGLADVNITDLISCHEKSNCLATLTAVKPPGRFGALVLDSNKVLEFKEKPDGDGGWINGGFFVLEPTVFDLLSGDSCTWELDPLSTLATTNQLNSYFHKGFWQPMDTLRDRQN